MYYGKENFNSESSLQHWKYIKRVRVNGKWKYYYDADQLKKDLGVTARDEANKAHDKAMVANAVAAVSAKDLEAAQKNAKKNTYERTTTTKKYKGGIKIGGKLIGGKLVSTSVRSTKEVAPAARKRLAEVEMRNNRVNQAAEKAKKDYYEKQAAYHKTPLGKLNKFVNKAKTSVEKLLGKDIWKDNEDFRVTRG